MLSSKETRNVELQGRVGVQEGIRLARLEETLQLEEWGYVEGGHDIDDADMRVRISSASIFARLLPKPGVTKVAARLKGQPAGNGAGIREAIA